MIERFNGGAKAALRHLRGRQRMAIRIKSRTGESIEQMLRRFKKLCEKEGLTKDVKRRQYYEKPSERRRREMRKTGPRGPRAFGGPRSGGAGMRNGAGAGGGMRSGGGGGPRGPGGGGGGRSRDS